MNIETKHMTEQELLEALREWQKAFVARMVDLPPDVMAKVREKLWELYL